MRRAFFRFPTKVAQTVEAGVLFLLKKTERSRPQMRSLRNLHENGGGEINVGGISDPFIHSQPSAEPGEVRLVLYVRGERAQGTKIVASSGAVTNTTLQRSLQEEERPLRS